MSRAFLLSISLSFMPLSSIAIAATMSAAEVKNEMLNRTVLTRRFGFQIRMRYRTNGTVTAKTIVGSQTGTWVARGNKICTTFPSGPAKGTSCVSFKRIGDKRYQSSAGVRFRVID